MKFSFGKLCLKKFSSSRKVINESQVEFYKQNGYLVIRDVFSSERIQKVKDEMLGIIRKQDPKELNTIFKADMNFQSKYFLESGDKIRFFLEADSFDKDGNIKYKLEECVNKVGHGIHDMNPIFKDFSYSNEVLEIMKGIGYKKPSIVQSMYILKSKRIGGPVSPHTDNTYIRSTPLSCMGIWIALDDAYVTNGGLYGVPKSHLNKTDYFMKLKTNQDGSQETYYNNEIKPTYSTEGAVPLEVKKGSIVLLHGDFVHFSEANTSELERHAYTLHIVETDNHIWEKDNWLQRPKENPFKIINI